MTNHASDHRALPDRRQSQQGSAPPAGQPERRLRPRRVSDALKMSCPYCGASESGVVRSRGTVIVDQVRRRRECGSCGNRFPTSEMLDEQALRTELGLEASDDLVEALRRHALKADAHDRRN